MADQLPLPLAPKRLVFSDETDALCGGTGVLICHCAGDRCTCAHGGQAPCPGCPDCSGTCPHCGGEGSVHHRACSIPECDHEEPCPRCSER